MKVKASAPSNIALIKYMGKIEGQGNRPTNSSISWTLESLRSFVQITLDENLNQDQWKPLQGEGLLPLPLSEKSVSRFLQHFKNLKNEFGIDAHFMLESANNFPSDCGLASSASSFAALTMAATDLFAKMGSEKAKALKVSDKAELSRKGSGSSCRSFFGPWGLWTQEDIKAMEFPMAPLGHQVIVVESEVKAVSSSEAHKRVSSSPLFNGRPERAEKRLNDLIEVLKQNPESQSQWKKAFEICWDEFQDMHKLFETSQPPFSYMTTASRKVLLELHEMWDKNGDGPLVTMDAGANIHLLYRQDQLALSKKIESHFSPSLKVITSKSFGVIK